MRPDDDKTTDKTRATVPQAAEALGITAEAVRARVKRGTLAHVKDPDGSVFVLLDADQTRQVTDKTADQSAALRALNERLADEVDFLRDELRRKDTIIMSLTQRIPELEAPSDASESRVRAADDAAKGSVPEDQPQRGFWARLFGG